MKKIKIVLVGSVVGLLFSMASFAQEMKTGVDLSFVFGWNIGFTTPVPVPNEVDITGYNPQFKPKLGANVGYFFNEKWGLGTGLTLDWKGMKVNLGVTDVHLGVDVPNVGYLTGYVTGKNTTRVNTLYLTQPVYGLYRFNPKWQVKGGIYMAETLSRGFKGNVREVDILVETPIMQERELSYATLNYSDDVRKFDLALLLGGEFRMNKHVGFYADATYGFIPFFFSEVPVNFTMRNIYFSVGVTYRL